MIWGFTEFRTNKKWKYDFNEHFTRADVKVRLYLMQLRIDRNFCSVHEEKKLN
jgi:hypothetical protein